MIDSIMENTNERVTKSDWPPAQPDRFCPFLSCCVLPCGCCLAIPLLFITLYVTLVLTNPVTWYKVEYVEPKDIPNVYQELAGEWILERVGIGLSNKGWRKTKFLLYEDGTCEIQNLILDLTNVSDSYPRQYPELTGKTLTGTWKFRDDGRYLSNRIFLIICLNVDAHVDIAPDMPPETAHYYEIDTYLSDATSYFLGNFTVWKVEQGGKESYRLKWCLFDSIDIDSYGPVLKRSN